MANALGQTGASIIIGQFSLGLIRAVEGKIRKSHAPNPLQITSFKCRRSHSSTSSFSVPLCCFAIIEVSVDPIFHFEIVPIISLGSFCRLFFGSHAALFDTLFSVRLDL